MGPMEKVVRGVVILPHKIPATDVIDIAVPIIIEIRRSIELRVVDPNVSMCPIIKIWMVICNPGIYDCDDHTGIPSSNIPSLRGIDVRIRGDIM